MKIVRGTSLTLELTIYDNNEKIYHLQAGDKIIFGVKLNPENTEYDIKKLVTTADSKGNIIITLLPNDTQNLALGVYYFDIGLQTADSDFYMVVECDEFIVCRAITAKEEET